MVSEDGKTSAIVVYLKKDQRLEDFIKTKDKYLKEKVDKEKYKLFIKDYEDYKNLYNKRNHQNINEIREVISRFGDEAKIHLGGIPMIADDMMTYIKSDIAVFGIGVFLFIILTLWLIFKNIKWVIIPLLGCATSVIIMIGLLGLIGWKVTVISSNFIALMLILNMAMNIHVTVRFLQLKKSFLIIQRISNNRNNQKDVFTNSLHCANYNLCFFIFNI